MKRDGLFTLPEQPEQHAALPHDTLVVRPRRQLLTNVTALPIVDAVHQVDVGLEREGREIGGSFRDSMGEAVELEVRGSDGSEEFGRG